MLNVLHITAVHSAGRAGTFHTFVVSPSTSHSMLGVIKAINTVFCSYLNSIELRSVKKKCDV